MSRCLLMRVPDSNAKVSSIFLNFTVFPLMNRFNSTILYFSFNVNWMFCCFYVIYIYIYYIYSRTFLLHGILFIVNKCQDFIPDKGQSTIPRWLPVDIRKSCKVTWLITNVSGKFRVRKPIVEHLFNLEMYVCMYCVL